MVHIVFFTLYLRGCMPLRLLVDVCCEHYTISPVVTRLVLYYLAAVRLLLVCRGWLILLICFGIATLYTTTQLRIYLWYVCDRFIRVTPLPF